MDNQDSSFPDDITPSSEPAALPEQPPIPLTEAPGEPPETAETPSTEAPAEPAETEATDPREDAPETPLGILTRFAETAKTHRLSPAEEEQAAGLLKELLLGGRASITSALEPLLALPWMISVNAITAVWTELSVVMRRHLLSGLAKAEGDHALRLRLSLARAVFKVDAPAGLKITSATVADLQDPETGTLTPKHRQIFYNVLIGKGKPWLLQLPLADLKASEADQIVHCAIQCFPFCPPLSQLSILRWAATAGRFKKISENDLALVAKSVGRWNVRLQRQLRAEVTDIPEVVAAVFKPDSAPKPAVAAPTGEAVEEAPTAIAATSIEGGAEAIPSEPVEVPPSVEAEVPAATPAEEAEPKAGEEKPRERERDKRRAERQERNKRGQKTEPEPAERGGKEKEQQRKPFDYKDSLRGLDAYITSLRSELEQTKSQLRRKEEEVKRLSGRRSDRVDDRLANVDVESLVRHNAQLEQTVQLLREQLEDLAAHHEAVAESRSLHGDSPIPEGSAEQLKNLLSIKLTESYETYCAMRLDPLDRVFRLDYRDLLGSVFDVLIQEGVKLSSTPSS